MRLAPIIQRLRARCPEFSGRVAGAAEFEPLKESANLTTPAAYVLPDSERVTDDPGMNEYQQTLRESFVVAVAVSNRDERGQAAADELHALRASIWRALLGWVPGDGYGWIGYEGGEILHLDRARLYYQFEFGADFHITNDQTAQAADLADLPEFAEMDFGVDAIDPADPNLGRPGPDGRIEAGADITIPND
jgi:hypothetical protein